MFEEHDLVRAAATECMCNLILSPEVRTQVPRFTIELKSVVFKSQGCSHLSVLFSSFYAEECGFMFTLFLRCRNFTWPQTVTD